MDDILLSINNLSIGFHTAEGILPVVEQLNFHIRRGETYALVGESGSGKTLTSLSILQLLPPDACCSESSEIFLEKQNLLKSSPINMGQIRGRRIGMVFQEPMTSLNPVMSIGKQIGEVLTTHFQLSHRAKRERILELLNIVGISDPKRRQHEFPHQFSGGMKQRVVIACALAGEPDLLIADEPTTALDATIQAQILELLQKLQQELNMSILLITHNLGVVSQVADRVGVISKGKLVEEANCRDFFKAPQHSYTKKLFAALPKPHFLSQKTFLQDVDDMHALLDVQDVAIYFPIRKGILKRTVAYLKAVDGVSLKINKGFTLALVGESGSGKTTLGRGIVHLNSITRGNIFYNERNVTHISQTELHILRRNIQIIFQDPFSSMNPRMMVSDILAEGIRTHRVIKDKEQLSKRIDELLVMVGLPVESQWRYPHEFSGGQRQRISIARALALNPQLIVCDEPTSALDVSIQDQILKLLKRLQKEYQLTYLFISHDLAVVSYMADEVAVMYLGRIVEQGPTAAIMQTPKHPYTQALLSAVPSIDPETRKKVIKLKGEQSSPVSPPTGCHFHPRCPHAMPICAKEYPGVTQLSEQHLVKCFLYGELT